MPLPPEKMNDLDAISREIHDAGLRRYIGADRTLKVGPKEKIDDGLRERIRRCAPWLLAELLVAEMTDWEHSSWTREERSRIDREAPADLREKRKELFEKIHAHYQAGDTAGVVEAIANYRTTQRAAALAIGIKDAPADAPAGEYDPWRDRKR